MVEFWPCHFLTHPADEHRKGKSLRDGCCSMFEPAQVHILARRRPVRLRLNPEDAFHLILAEG